MKTLIRLLHLRGFHRKVTLFRVNKLLAGTKAKNFEKKRKLLNSLDGFSIGAGTRIVGPVENFGNLIIGEICWVGKNLRVNGNGTVTIGNNCDIAPEVTFQTGGHRIGEPDRRAGCGTVCSQSVGDGTWIGVGVTVLNDTHIGNGCVVAGCACVVKDVADNTLVGGVPAKEIRGL